MYIYMGQPCKARAAVFVVVQTGVHPAFMTFKNKKGSFGVCTDGVMNIPLMRHATSSAQNSHVGEFLISFPPRGP